MGRKPGGKNSFHKPATTVIRIPELEKWAFKKMKGILKEDRGDSIDERVYPNLEAALDKATEYSFNSRRSVYIYNREFYYWISLVRPEDIESYEKRLDLPKCGVVTVLKNGKVVDQ